MAGTSYSVVIPAPNAVATLPRVLASLAAQELVLPRLVVAEWSLGASALHYAFRRPALRGESQPQFE